MNAFRHAAVAAAAVLLLLASCERPGEERCREACLHYSKLFVDETWGAKIAEATSTEEREALEREKEAEWQDVQENPERGLGSCVAACNRPARRHGAVDCILGATTFAQAKACDKD